MCPEIAESPDQSQTYPWKNSHDVEPGYEKGIRWDAFNLLMGLFLLTNDTFSRDIQNGRIILGISNRKSKLMLDII